MAAWATIQKRTAGEAKVPWLHRAKKEDCPVLQPYRQGPLVNDVIQNCDHRYL